MPRRRRTWLPLPRFSNGCLMTEPPVSGIQALRTMEAVASAMQRSTEANDNHYCIFVQVQERYREAVGDCVRESRYSEFGWRVASSSLREKLEDSISEEEKQALIIAKSNELAALLTSHQDGSMPRMSFGSANGGGTKPPAGEHEWVKPTREDYIEDLLSFGKPSSRGYPPLSFRRCCLTP